MQKRCLLFRVFAFGAVVSWVRIPHQTGHFMEQDQFAIMFNQKQV